MKEIDSTAIAAATRRICEQVQKHESLLNALDAEIGDGDLGGTLASVAAAITPRLDELSDDVGVCLKQIADVIATRSGSSLCALMIIALTAVSRSTTGKTKLCVSELGAVLDIAIDAMQRAGRSKPGDKTIVDGILAIREAIGKEADCRRYVPAATRAINEAVAKFRDRPSRIGRARIAGKRSAGCDDPGMIALKLSVDALAGTPRETS